MHKEKANPIPEGIPQINTTTHKTVEVYINRMKEEIDELAFDVFQGKTKIEIFDFVRRDNYELEKIEVYSQIPEWYKGKENELYIHNFWNELDSISDKNKIQDSVIIESLLFKYDDDRLANYLTNDGVLKSTTYQDEIKKLFQLNALKKTEGKNKVDKTNITHHKIHPEVIFKPLQVPSEYQESGNLEYGNLADQLSKYSHAIEYYFVCQGYYKSAVGRLSCFVLTLGFSKDIFSNNLKNGISLHTISSNFKRIISKYNTNVLDLAFQKRVNDHNRAARRAAISQVMARNGSHNLGSHVLSNLITSNSLNTLIALLCGPQKQYFIKGQNAQALEDINYTDLVQYDKLKIKHQPYTYNEDGDIVLNSKFKDFLTTYNFSYIKSRMDFLADVATLSGSMEFSTKFKIQILGEYERNLLLLNSISGVKDFFYTIKYRNRVLCTETKPAHYCNNCSVCKSKSYNDDLNVVMPNGILGQHAFYVLLENFIRNTSKYSRRPKDNKVEITIEIFDGEKYGESLNDFYVVYLFDNCTIPDEDVEWKNSQDFKKKFKSFYKKYWNKEVFGSKADLFGPISNDNETEPKNKNETIKKIDKLIITQNYRLSENIVDQKLVVRTGGLGLIEMDVCAGYLRKEEIGNIDNEEFNILPKGYFGDEDMSHLINYGNNKEKNKKPYLLKALKIKDDITFPDSNNNYSLGYRFLLLKPKLAVIYISSKSTELGFTNSDYLTELKMAGILVIHANEETLFNNPNQIYNHEFLVREKGILKEQKLNDNISKISPRIIDLNEEFFGEIYHKWINEKSDYSILENEFSVHFYKKELEKQKEYGAIRVSDKRVDFENQDSEVIRFNQNPKVFNSFYDNHGDYWELARNLYAENKIQFLNPFSSITVLNNPLFENQNYVKSDNLVDYFKVFEASNHKVLIIDERVQDCLDHRINKITNSERFRTMNIYVPEPAKDCNLNTADFLHREKDEDASKNTRDKIIKYISENINIVDTIIIHIGLIEKCQKNKGKNTKLVEKFLSRYIRKERKKHKRQLNILLTSGRGKPDTLPNNEKFINFSLLSKALIENRSKLELVDVIYKARSINV